MQKYKMKSLTYVMALFSIFSCKPNQGGEKQLDIIENNGLEISKSSEKQLLVGERINGPANVRNEPNGDVLFELNDNALVELKAKTASDWYEVLVYVDIDFNEFGMDTILSDRFLIVKDDTVGKVIKSHYVRTGKGGDFAYAMLYGFTHKNNIKPETVIETSFKRNLKENGRDFSAWKGFIETFKLNYDAVDYQDFETYYNYENSIEDPSPGFRFVLLFQEMRLVGIIHSRELEIGNAITHKLNWTYYVTFFDDISEKQQLKFLDYMNQWLQEVD